MKKFWNWKNQTQTNQETQETVTTRTLFLNGTIAEESWFDDDITPTLFKEELLSGSGDITVWINSPGGDCVAAAQIYSLDGFSVHLFGVLCRLQCLCFSAQQLVFFFQLFFFESGL